MSETAPLPWTLTKSRFIDDANGEGVCFLYATDGPIMEERGNRIVRAVNSHNDLLAACERLVQIIGTSGRRLPCPELMTAARAAIAKAKGTMP